RRRTSSRVAWCLIPKRVCTTSLSLSWTSTLYTRPSSKSSTFASPLSIEPQHLRMRKKSPRFPWTKSK
ncbi:hypothetical protein BN1723_020885, partial [Verticillium longisporum]